METTITLIYNENSVGEIEFIFDKSLFTDFILEKYWITIGKVRKIPKEIYDGLFNGLTYSRIQVSFVEVDGEMYEIPQTIYLIKSDIPVHLLK